VAGVLVVAPSASAATRCVNPADTPTCFATVQAAVDAATSGDTITVVAGTYAEDVTITKALTLKGAQTGVDGRNRTATETILRSVNVAAGDVTIDGFAFSDSATTQLRVTGGAAALSGVRVENNVFTNYADVALIPDTAGNIVIRHNDFHAPHGAAEPMQVKDNFAVGGCNGAQVVENRFVGATTNGSADVNLSCNAHGGATGITVSGNSSSGNDGDDQGASLVAAAGVDSMTISDNTASTQGSPIFFWGQVAGTVTISGNDLTSALGSAISLGNNFGANTGTFTISGNALAGHPNGLKVTSGTVQATGNWWGSITGPTVSGNASGTGSTIVGTATWSPWCTTSSCAARSDDATLAALSLSSGTLSPAFASSTTAYTASVDASVSAVTVTATPATGGATVVSGGSSLATGANTVTVTTTSYDGAAHRTYTITITRAAPVAAAPPVTTPPVTTPPVTSPPVSAPPVTAPPGNTTAPVAAPAKPGQSGSAVVAVPAAPPADPGSGAPPTPPPVKVSVAWPAAAFKEPVTVTVTPTTRTPAPPAGPTQPVVPGEPIGGPATGPTPPETSVGGGLSLGTGNAVVSLAITNEAGEPVTRFEAPLEIRIDASEASNVPAYSRDGKTWTTIPRLTSLPIPDGQDDGYFVNADGSVSIFTRHATLFGLLTDAEAPAVEAFGIILSADRSTLRFVWRASDNVDVAAVVLARDEALLAVPRASATSVTLPRRDGNYAFAALDGAGNVTRSDLVSVHGSTVVHDVAPPSRPHLRASIVHKDHVRFRWGASTDQLGVAYLVFRNGVFVLRTTDLSVTLPAAEGRYTVDAIDAVGELGRAGHRSTSNGIRLTRPSVHGRPWRAWPA
jgi:hypothetical protein